MPADIAALLAQGAGGATVTDASQYSIEASRLRHLCRSGLLTRAGNGAYVATTELEGTDSWAALRLRGKGYVLSRSPGAYLVEEAAAAILGLRTVGAAPRLPVIATSADVKTGTTEFGTMRHVALAAKHTRVIDDRFAVMSPAWVVCDLARRLPLVPALVMVDGVARQHALELVRAEPRQMMLDSLNMADALASMTRWPGSRRAGAIVELADPGAERAIETLGRLAFMDAGLPPPVSNAWVRVGDGQWRRVDHLFPWHGVVAEADGAIKYDNRPDASRIVADEKEREWELRELGLVVGRYTWMQARAGAAKLGARVRRLLTDNPPREQPVPYWVGLPGGERVPATPDTWPSPAPTGRVRPLGPRW